MFGYSLFLGWGAMALGMLGGLVMMCGSFYVEGNSPEFVLGSFALWNVNFDPEAPHN